MNINKSKILFRKAEKCFPGGVNSPVRAFKAVGGNPIFVKSARGSVIYDVDGNKYIDFICSWGALILGHAHPLIIKAIGQASKNGTSYGMNSESECKLAKIIIGAFPSIEKVRLVNSGTEAVMAAIRLARGFTRRDKIIKFEGCYHGHSDGLLVKAGSGVATFSIPDSAGVSPNTAKDTISIPYNNLESLKGIIRKDWKNIAAVIIEPIAANMGVVTPSHGFLKNLRMLTDRHGILLIFDEVITGFRVAYGGAQSLYGIKPDLTVLGKIIGGGMPIGAFGGKKEIMNHLAPEGNVYQAGTFSGNPVTVAAGLKALEILTARQITLYKELEEKAVVLEKGFQEGAQKNGVSVRINRIGSMFTMFFTNQPVYNYQSALTSETKMFGRYFRKMLNSGINLPPSQFEASFISNAHSWQDIHYTIKAQHQSMASV